MPLIPSRFNGKTAALLEHAGKQLGPVKELHVIEDFDDQRREISCVHENGLRSLYLSYISDVEVKPED